MLLRVADEIRKNDIWRKEQDIRRLKDYGNTPLIGFGLSGYTRPAIATRRKVGYNVTKAVADTFVAKVTKDRPKVSVVTEQGDWELQEKAKGMESFLEGQFYELGLYEIGPQVCLDGGGIFGTGCIKFWIDGVYGAGEESKDGTRLYETACISAMRILPYELLIDSQEAIRGKPPNILQECWVDRLQLMAQYEDEPEKVEAIRTCKPGADSHVGVHGALGYDSTADQVLVIEGWHLPSRKGGKDGMHIIGIHGCTLSAEPWSHDWHPFAWYRKQQSPVGFWGISLADETESLQTNINAKCMRLETALRMVGAAHVLVHSASKVNFSQWDNEIGSKIEYTGIKPELFVPTNVVPQELVASIETDYHRAFEITGIQESQAQGGVPSNLESGKAQEIYLDVTDQRMQVAIHNYHQMFLDAADIILELGREIVEKYNPEFGAKATSDKGGLRKVLLSEVDMKKTEYLLKKWPSQALADDPAKRMAQVQNMANAGWIAPDQAKRLLWDMPDIAQDMSLENASYDAVEMCISEMLNHGRYIKPIPMLNPQQAPRQVLLAIVKAWKDKRPEDRQQLLRDFYQDLQTMFAQAQPPPTPGVATAPGTPQPPAQGQPQLGAQPAPAPPNGVRLQ